VDESGFSSVTTISPWFSMLLYHLGITNRLIGGCSSETKSHPIDMIIILMHATCLAYLSRSDKDGRSHS
jgi:hypothetical protein